jgi:CcmD family protein
MMIRSALIVLVSLLLAGPVLLAGQPPPATEEFRPVSELPPSEQLPGGAFVVVAYAFIWVATMAYVWFIFARLRKVEQDMKALEKRSAPEGGRR